MDLGNNAIYNDEEITIIEDFEYENETLNQINTTESIIKLEEPLRTLEIEGNIVYDEIVIENNVAYIYRNIGLNENGNLVQLNSTVVELYGELPIRTYDGNTYIHIKDIDELEYTATYIEENPFTNKFMLQLEGRTNFKINSEQIASKVSKDEMNSIIDQKADEINFEVKKKVNNADYTSAQILAMINGDVSEVVIKGDKLDINGKEVNFITNVIDNYYYSNEDFEKIKAYISNQTTLTDEEIEILDVNGDGTVRATDYMRIKNAIEQNGGYLILQGNFQIDPKNIKRTIVFRDADGKIITSIGFQGMTTPSMSVKENLFANSITTENLSTDGFKKADCGEVSITPSAENTLTGKAVSFNTSFSGVPIVTTTPKSTEVGATVLGSGVSGISNTGCTIYVMRKNTTDTDVEWIAMETI